eukprot:gene260-772_t
MSIDLLSFVRSVARIYLYTWHIAVATAASGAAAPAAASAPAASGDGVGAGTEVTHEERVQHGSGFTDGRDRDRGGEGHGLRDGVPAASVVVGG